jgi:hypothetical protein
LRLRVLKAMRHIGVLVCGLISKLMSGASDQAVLRRLEPPDVEIRRGQSPMTVEARSTF